MTIRSSKKPLNNSKDASTNQQQQQPTSALTRALLSHDDERSDATKPIDDSASSEDETVATLPSTTTPATGIDDAQSMVTTSPIFSNHSKRKSHYRYQHLCQTINNKQARRRGNEVDENVPTSTSSDSSNEPFTSTSWNHVAAGQEEADQCNSEDEHEHSSVKYDQNNLNELEIRFARALKEKKGLIIKAVQEDGACLFRAVSDQVFGDEEMHATVRQNCMDYIVKNRDFFRAYITEDFDHYVERKRRQNCHGNHIEIIALSEIYNRPIEVYEYSLEPINVVQGMYKTDNEPIRLSYHCGVHYNAINDPWRPTAGHGLGLPDLQPGRAQETLMVNAIRQSEESHIERTMLDDKLAATDWEATQDELIQQISRESYLQWLCETNQQTKDNQTMSSANASANASDGTADGGNEATSSKNLLPLKLDERTDCQFALPFHYEATSASNSNLDNDDDDDSLMQQVLAISRIEYVETLKKQQEQSSKSNDPNEPSSSDT